MLIEVRVLILNRQSRILNNIPRKSPPTPPLPLLVPPFQPRWLNTKCHPPTQVQQPTTVHPHQAQPVSDIVLQATTLVATQTERSGAMTNRTRPRLTPAIPNAAVLNPPLAQQGLTTAYLDVQRTGFSSDGLRMLKISLTPKYDGKPKVNLGEWRQEFPDNTSMSGMKHCICQDNTSNMEQLSSRVQYHRGMSRSPK